MEEETLLSNMNHTGGSKVKHTINKKRKGSVIEESSESLHILKKKKKLLKHIFPLEKYEYREDFKFLKNERITDYVTISAKPEKLPPVPQIFQRNKFKITDSDVSSFLSKILSSKCYNTEVSDRFIQLDFNSHRANENEGNKREKKFFLEKFHSKKNEMTEKNEEIKEKGIEKKKMENSKESMRQKTDISNEKNNVNEEGIEITNHVDIYKGAQNKSLIFHMSHPCNFSFHGEIKATIIMGEVEILGYTLGPNSSSKSVDLYSPNFCTALVVETKGNVRHTEMGEDLQCKLKDFLTEEDCKTLLNKIKAEDSLLLVEQITSDLGIVLNKYFDKVLFPKDLVDVSSMTETMESLQSIFTFKLSKEGKHFRKNPQWEKIPLGHCTVLCGGKAVGKSMLLRYYVNKFLAVGERILVLDFDPGQPEFTFPGCISAVVVDKPLIGPNFTHVLDPLIMAYFGDVDVSKNPTKYLECVKYVTENCKKREELLKMKWLVNTMGFCKGLGVDLIISILKLVNPNSVIQIKSSDLKNNYPFYLTSVALNAKSGFVSMPMRNLELSHELRVVRSSAEREKKQFQGGLKRKQLRDIMSISYFSRMVSPPFYNLNAVQPYIVSFSKIYLGVDFLVHPNDVMKAFNASIVSLSCYAPDGEEILTTLTADSDYFQIIVKPRVVACLGIGFVRGIDCKNKKFYVLTHLTSDILTKVNCLSLGRVSPPHPMFLKQETVEGQTAYTTTCTANIIKSVRRIFRVPGTPSGKDRVH